MKQFINSATAVLMIATASGCGIIPAPGADNVKITRTPADVASCTPVGNISAEAMMNADSHAAKNKAVGLNADVILNTGDGGIAYRCAK